MNVFAEEEALTAPPVSTLSASLPASTSSSTTTSLLVGAILGPKAGGWGVEGALPASVSPVQDPEALLAHEFAQLDYSTRPDPHKGPSLHQTFGGSALVESPSVASLGHQCSAVLRIGHILRTHPYPSVLNAALLKLTDLFVLTYVQTLPQLSFSLLALFYCFTFLRQYSYFLLICFLLVLVLVLILILVLVLILILVLLLLSPVWVFCFVSCL